MQMKDNRTIRQADQRNKTEEPGFWSDFFSFTKDGKLKSMFFLYALVLAFLILFVFFFAQHFITIGFEAWFPGLDRTLLNVLDIAIPALLCTALFCIVEYFLKDRSLIPTSFLIALLIVLIVFLYVLLTFPAGARETMLQIVGYMFLIPIAAATLCLFVMARYCPARK